LGVIGLSANQPSPSKDEHAIFLPVSRVSRSLRGWHDFPASAFGLGAIFSTWAELRHPWDVRRYRYAADLYRPPPFHDAYFAEIETGSATIWDQEKLTSTLAKLNRYSLFLRGYAGNVHHGDSSTFYSRAFPDHWPAEVLFVTPGAHRRDSINQAYEKWKFGRGGAQIVVRAMTLA